MEQWTDDISGMDKFSYDVYEVIDSGPDLIINHQNTSNSAVNLTSTTGTLKLQWEPALYVMEMFAHDVAGNAKQARRYILYDNSSKIQVSPQHPMYILSARADKDYQWQNTLQVLHVNWTDHFYNTFHVQNNRLKPIRGDGHGHLPCPYDQCHGELNIYGTRNVHGVVGFGYYVTEGGQNVSESQTFVEINDFEPQQYNISHPIVDGQKYTIWMKGKDIMNNTIIDATDVKIDSTPAEVWDLGLLNNGFKELYVHSVRDLSKMKLHFKAWDEHSGLEHIIWKLGTDVDMTDIGSGSLSIRKTVSFLKLFHLNNPCIHNGMQCNLHN